MCAFANATNASCCERSIGIIALRNVRRKPAAEGQHLGLRDRVDVQAVEGRRPRRAVEGPAAGGGGGGVLLRRLVPPLTPNLVAS